MADDYAAIADLIADKLDLSDAQVTDLALATPFLNLLPMETSSNGTQHKYTKETGAPVVGFRAENAGREMDHSVDTLVTVTLKILDWSFDVDKAVADAWMKGPEAWIAREGMRHLKAALKAFETQVIYGDQSPGDTGGFAGIVDAATVAAYDDAMVVNATGSTADTGSSVYAVRVGPDDVTGIYRGDGVVDVGETVVTKKIVDAGSDNTTFPAYYTPACAWLGLQVGSIHSLGRIINLTAQAGKGLTDDLLSQLLELSPVGKEPTHFVMSRRSRGQLQRSRTATNATGAEAPRPTEYEGIPIVVTDSVVNTEAISAA